MVQPGLAAGTFTEVLVCFDYNWVLVLVRIREILLVEIEKTSLYHMLVAHRIHGHTKRYYCIGNV